MAKRKRLKSKKLSRQPLAVLALFAVLVAARTYIFFAFPPATEASDLTTSNILSAINKERTLRNLVTLNENNLLDQAAQYKADDMQARHYFAHIDPDGHYIWDKIVALGYTPYLQLGENLAINFYDTESLVSAWMQSPTHRENILNSGFRDQGMGVNLGNTNDNEYYSAIANTFGTLATKAATITPLPPPSPKPASKPAAQPATKGAKQATTTPAPQLTVTTTPTSTVSAPPGVVQNNPPPQATAQRYNRYLTLGLGAIILLMLLSDAIAYLKNKTGHLDKKINNIVLLILSLIVVALMYFL